jgi:mannose-6-phosphate isomerase-like protein (cupin superfamily)
MRLRTAICFALPLLACTRPGGVTPGRAAPAPATPAPVRGSVIPAHAGTPLVFCGTPGLSVNIKVDSGSTGATRFAAGTAELAAGAVNAASHANNDEVMYFLTAGGRAFVGADTTEIHPGLMLYVPRGVHHGFVSAPDRPVRFVWMIAPQDLARGFRARGVAPGSACPAPGG